jgi:hypothetical protein
MQYHKSICISSLVIHFRYLPPSAMIISEAAECRNLKCYFDSSETLSVVSVLFEMNTSVAMLMRSWQI